jgi:eukaryotic-like serine/threonine-protein kinase
MQDDISRIPAVQQGTVPVELGHDLGKYRLIAEIARGGMGVAYLAVLRGPEGFRKLVVVKELRRELRDTRAWVTMFMNEARLAARLNHPNIVQTIEVGTDGSRRFIAMEYLDGQPLQQLVQRALKHAMRLPLRIHLGILLDLLAALEYAHGLADFDGTPLGLVHRDVSPHNVIVTYEGQIKLVDFGISKTASGLEQPRAGVVHGKVRYMAPEQAAGARVDRRADVFAVGAMLWEAIVGRRPWEGQPDAAVLQSLITGAVPHVRDAWPDIDPALAAIVERAMTFDADARYPTALAMREDLERYIDTRRMAPPSARALGTSVLRLFAEDRERRQALIDTQLRALNGGDHGSPPSDKIAMIVPVSRVPAPAVLETSTLSSPSSEGTPSSTAASSVALPPSRSVSTASTVLSIAAAAGFGALLALAAVTSERFRARDVPVAPVAAPASAPVPVAPLAAAPLTSHLTVIASPASAQLYVDDVAVSNPCVAELPRDRTEHRLRVEAPGYETKTRTLTFAEDADLEIALRRLGPAVPAPWRAALRPAPPHQNCQPPYVVDSVTGLKHWKLECLESEPPSTETSADALTVQPKPIDTGSPYTP